MNKVFIDTNLLVYLATSETHKCTIVENVIKKSNATFIGVQVLNEFAAVCFRKKLLPFDTIQQYVSEYNMCFNITLVDYHTI